MLNIIMLKPPRSSEHYQNILTVPETYQKKGKEIAEKNQTFSLFLLKELFT